MTQAYSPSQPYGHTSTFYRERKDLRPRPPWVRPTPDEREALIEMKAIIQTWLRREFARFGPKEKQQ